MRNIRRAAVLALLVALSAPQLSAQWAEQARVGVHPAAAQPQNDAVPFNITLPPQQKAAGRGAKIAGALTGAMVGFLAGGALGAGIQQLACGDDTECWGDSHGMLGPLVGATIGTIVGIPIGIRIVSRGASPDAEATSTPGSHHALSR